MDSVVVMKRNKPDERCYHIPTDRIAQMSVQRHRERKGEPGVMANLLVFLEIEYSRCTSSPPMIGRSQEKL